MYRMLSTMCVLTLISSGLAGCDSTAPEVPSTISAEDWWDGMSADLRATGPDGIARKGHAARNDRAHVDVKGLNIVVEIDAEGNPFDTNLYRFHAKSMGDEVKGKFRTRGEGPGDVFGDARGEIVCVGVAPDGMTAWLGGFIVIAESNTVIEGAPDFTGTWAIWSVGVAEDGSALASTTFLGVPTEGIALDHCSTGFDLPLQETTGIVQIRRSESGMGLGRTASD